jgi:hypothetical protein
LIPQLEEKKRPVRVAATRQREMMAILRNHLNNESAERLDVDEMGLGSPGAVANAECYCHDASH